MTGKTHRVGGMLACLTGYSVLQSKGMLIGNLHPLTQLAVIYPFAIYGSMVSDMDHDWDSVPSKDVFSWFVWKALHFTTPLRRWLKNGGKIKKWVYRKTHRVIDLCDSKHRSWQTHSDLFLILMLFLSGLILHVCSETADAMVLALMLEGIFLGIISHLVLDLLTPDGIWSVLKTLVCKILGKKGMKKIHFVPRKKFFATSEDESPWERFIRKIMWVTCFILVFRLIYVFSPYRIVFNA